MQFSWSMATAKPKGTFSRRKARWTSTFHARPTVVESIAVRNEHANHDSSDGRTSEIHARKRKRVGQNELPFVNRNRDVGKLAIARNVLEHFNF